MFKMLNLSISPMKKNNIKCSIFLLQWRRNRLSLLGGKYILFMLCISMLACGGPSFEDKPLTEVETVTSSTKKENPKSNSKKKNERCEFDMKQQTDEFLKDKPHYAGYTWNNQLKEAKLLLNGKDSLTIRRGGCHYFEFSINLKSLSFDNTIDDSTFWFNTALSYAKDLFDKTDYEWLKKNIDTREYDVSNSEDVRLYSFPHEKYDEFYIRLSSENKPKEMEIGYSYTLNSEK